MLLGVNGCTYFGKKIASDSSWIWPAFNVCRFVLYRRKSLRRGCSPLSHESWWTTELKERTSQSTLVGNPSILGNRSFFERLKMNRPSDLPICKFLVHYQFITVTYFTCLCVQVNLIYGASWCPKSNFVKDFKFQTIKIHESILLAWIWKELSWHILLC